MGKDSDKVIRWKKEHEKRGLCISCNREAVPGFKSCALHLEKNRERARRWRKNNPKRVKEYRSLVSERYRKEGRCSHCGAPLLEDYPNKICVNCITRSNYGGYRFGTFTKTITVKS